MFFSHSCIHRISITCFPFLSNRFAVLVEFFNFLKEQNLSNILLVACYTTEFQFEISKIVIRINQNGIYILLLTVIRFDHGIKFDKKNKKLCVSVESFEFWSKMCGAQWISVSVTVRISNACAKLNHFIHLVVTDIMEDWHIK